MNLPGSACSSLSASAAESFPVTFYSDERISGWKENYVYKLPSGEIVAVYDDVTERKQIEEKLKESEERFYKAFYANPDAVSITRLGQGEFIEVNDSFTRVFGYTRDEVMGHGTLELGLWLDAKQREEVQKEFMEKARQIWEELGLPNLNPESPWYGYLLPLSQWSKENEEEAELALRGEHYVTGAKRAKMKVEM